MVTKKSVINAHQREKTKWPHSNVRAGEKVRIEEGEWITVLEYGRSMKRTTYQRRRERIPTANLPLYAIVGLLDESIGL